MSADIAAILDAARARLGGAPEVALGEVREGRRLLGIPRAARIVPAGTAWHLGVLLLTEDAVLATGEVVRAREDAILGFAAESQRERAAVAAAASRGGFADGRAVHVGWRVIDLDAVGPASSPLAVREGIPSVRWSAAGGYVPLAGYLEDRVDLLVHPPERA